MVHVVYLRSHTLALYKETPWHGSASWKLEPDSRLALFVLNLHPFLLAFMDASLVSMSRRVWRPGKWWWDGYRWYDILIFLNQQSSRSELVDSSAKCRWKAQQCPRRISIRHCWGMEWTNVLWKSNNIGNRIISVFTSLSIQPPPTWQRPSYWDQEADGQLNSTLKCVTRRNIFRQSTGRGIHPFIKWDPRFIVISADDHPLPIKNVLLIHRWMCWLAFYYF